MPKFIIAETNKYGEWEEISLPLSEEAAQRVLNEMRYTAEMSGDTERQYKLIETSDEPEERVLYTYSVYLVGKEDCFPPMQRFIEAENRAEAIQLGNRIPHYRVTSCYEVR